MAAFRLIGLLVALLMAASADAAPSDLDTSFGPGGVIGISLATTGSMPFAALQSDGKLLLAEVTQQSTAIATTPTKLSWLIQRYTVDGSSDMSFGTNSSVIVSFDVIFEPEGNVGNDYPAGIVLLPDGRFVVAGTSVGGCGIGAGCESALIAARFNADGSLDDSFGSHGKIIQLGPGADSLALQSDGKILTFSSSGGFILAEPPSPLLRRLNVDGSPDNGFAPAIACVGKGTFRLSPDGKIVVVTALTRSPSSYGICITRLNAAGTPDTAFGTQGTSFVGAGAFGLLTDFFIDAAGRIVVAGSTTTPILFRLTADGSLDTRFGSGGMVPIDAVSSVTAITGDCQNRTLVAGLRSDPVFNNSYALMARFLPEGSIDAAFTDTPNGFARTYLSDVDQLLVRPNGRFLAQGVQAFSVQVAPQFQIIQYQGDSPCSEAVAVEYYYLAWNCYFETAFPDEIAALDDGAFGGAWQRTGETFNVWPQPNASASPTCRFFSTSFAPKSSHFYTPFPAECAILKTNPNWQFESVAFYVQIPDGYGTGNGSCSQGTVALYRAYNNGMGGAPNHRYTTSLATLNTMLAQGWLFEGEANTKVFACVPQ